MKRELNVLLLLQGARLSLLAQWSDPPCNLWATSTTKTMSLIHTRSEMERVLPEFIEISSFTVLKQEANWNNLTIDARFKVVKDRRKPR